jgi:uncharacterized membrane-anchored protein
MNKHKVFFGSVIFLVLVLVGFIFVQERIVSTGTQVILETRPVDPRDLFRGEYVILRYKIENDTLVNEEISNNDLTDGSSVYVRLAANDNQIASVAEVSMVRPDFSNGLWMRGEVDGRRVRFPDLEQYFVPEGAGTPIERLRNDVYVKVSILDGEARIVGLLDKNLDEIDVYDYREKG